MREEGFPAAPGPGVYDQQKPRRKVGLSYASRAKAPSNGDHRTVTLRITAQGSGPPGPRRNAAASGRFPAPHPRTASDRPAPLHPGPSPPRLAPLPPSFHTQPQAPPRQPSQVRLSLSLSLPQSVLPTTPTPNRKGRVSQHRPQAFLQGSASPKPTQTEGSDGGGGETA